MFFGWLLILFILSYCSSSTLVDDDQENTFKTALQSRDFLALNKLELRNDLKAIFYTKHVQEGSFLASQHVYAHVHYLLSQFVQLKLTVPMQKALNSLDLPVFKSFMKHNCNHLVRSQWRWLFDEIIYGHQQQDSLALTTILIIKSDMALLNLKRLDFVYRDAFVGKKVAKAIKAKAGKHFRLALEQLLNIENDGEEEDNDRAYGMLLQAAHYIGPKTFYKAFNCTNDESQKSLLMEALTLSNAHATATSQLNHSFQKDSKFLATLRNRNSAMQSDLVDFDGEASLVSIHEVLLNFEHSIKEHLVKALSVDAKACLRRFFYAHSPPLYSHQTCSIVEQEEEGDGCGYVLWRDELDGHLRYLAGVMDVPFDLAHLIYDYACHAIEKRS